MIDATRLSGTSIQTSDAAVKAAAGVVYWVAASAGATGGAWQLNDSGDDSGTDLLSVVMPASTVQFFGPFDPPIRFRTGIFADIPGTNITLTVAFG